METPPRPAVLQTLLRGLRRRCPRCGEGALFAGWNRLHEHCAVCGLAFEKRSGDTWFFMYISTAGLTGLLVVTMFLLRPRVLWFGQVLVALAAVAIIGLSLPYRKGMAVALDYLLERPSPPRPSSPDPTPPPSPGEEGERTNTDNNTDEHGQ